MLALIVAATVGPLQLSVDARAAGGSSISWRPHCATPAPKGARCGLLYVPLDYQDGGQGSISERIIEVPPADPSHSLGDLFVNPGGPGGSGFDFVSYNFAVLASLHPYFTIVGFDPRGVTGPDAITCAGTAETDAIVGFNPIVRTAAERAHVLSLSKQYANSCARHSLRLLPYMGTVNVARDMDSLRAALGQRTISYLGLSYGSSIGYTYAQLFPRRLRAIALDGVVSPGEPLLQQTVDQANGFEANYQHFLAVCRSQSYCALNPDPGQKIAAVLARLKKSPATVNGRQFTFGDALSVLGDGLYDPSGYDFDTYISYYWYEATQGDYSDLQSYLDSVTGRGPHGYDHSSASNSAVECLDMDVPAPDKIFDVGARAQATDPHFGDLIVTAWLSCDYWPVPSQPLPVKRVVNAPRALLVGGSHDLATPLAWTWQMHREFPSSVLIRNGYGHTSFSTSACVRGVVDDYLFTLALPASGTHCESDF